MRETGNAFEFHSVLESPREYLSRERFTIAIWVGIFIAVMLAAILSVDPAYYYPRLITDQLLYYMKALSFVQHGTTDARAAINSPPFHYAAAPGLLRAPWMMMFRDFDDQLRAIQLSNMAFAATLGVLSSYIVSWVLPKPGHSLAVAFSFVTLLLNPTWITNVLSPLADLPYAVFTLGAIVVLTRILCGTEGERASLCLKVLFLALFFASFSIRFTAPALLLFGWLLREGWKRGRLRGRMGRLEIGIIAVGLAILGALNYDAIVLYYLRQPFEYLAKSELKSMALNASALAIPSQLIPGYELLFRRSPVVDPFHPVFGTNPFDLSLVFVGLGITAVTLLGMWRARTNLRPELGYVLLPFPVLAALIPSTPRYLLSYQPFLWMFMYVGSTALLPDFATATLKRPVFRWSFVVLAVVAAGLALYTRSERLSGGSAAFSSFSLGATRRHAPEVAQTYRSLRNFLERLPRDRSLVIQDLPSNGQWKVIAGIDHYRLDSGVASVMQQRDVYLIVSCALKSECSAFEASDDGARARVRRFATVNFERVFDAGTPYAMARVYRMRPAQ